MSKISSGGHSFLPLFRSVFRGGDTFLHFFSVLMHSSFSSGHACLPSPEEAPCLPDMVGMMDSDMKCHAPICSWCGRLFYPFFFGFWTIVLSLPHVYVSYPDYIGNPIYCAVHLVYVLSFVEHGLLVFATYSQLCYKSTCFSSNVHMCDSSHLTASNGATVAVRNCTLFVGYFIIKWIGGFNLG